MTTAAGPQVVDASVAFAALLDASAGGEWALQQLTSGPLVSPHLMPFEVSNIIRRSVVRGAVEHSEGRTALHDLDRMPIDLIPFSALVDRSWELRENLTSYDAAYVAAAELVGGTLLTLDGRIATAPGIRCQVITGP